MERAGEKEEEKAGPAGSKAGSHRVRLLWISRVQINVWNSEMMGFVELQPGCARIRRIMCNEYNKNNVLV